MRTATLAAVALALAWPARADMIRLSTGKNMQGRVTRYANTMFEIKDTKGAVTKIPAASVVSIDFEKGSVPAKLETRNRGTVEGKLWLYNNATFSVEDAKGRSDRIPASVVSSASFDAKTGTGPGASAAVTPSGAKDVELIARGNDVDVKKHLVRGKVTVVDFYADWCGPCRMISPYLEKLAKDDSDVVLRKVDVVRWGSPITQRYNIRSIPHIEIYDRAGKLVGTVSGADQRKVADLVTKAKAAS